MSVPVPVQPLSGRSGSFVRRLTYTYERPQDHRTTSPTSTEASVVHGYGDTSISSQANLPGHWSQSFSRSYGSNLPTSLTYIILSTRGCSPWRPDAVIGTERYGMIASIDISRVIQWARDTTKTVMLFGNNVPISGWTDSRESVP